MLAAIIVVFVVGYLAIVFEHQIHINKSASAIVTGVLCWTIYAIGYEQLVPQSAFDAWEKLQPTMDGDTHAVMHLHTKLEFLTEYQLPKGFVEVAGILFFLLGAMTIVELVDANEGFSLVTKLVKARNKVTLLWTVGWVTFFLSSILDNLTTAIVVVSILKKLIAEKETRLVFVGIAVIAANAGGAWTVTGDVTTTMIWVKNKISTLEVMRDLFLSSAVCLLVPLLLVSRRMRGELPAISTAMDDNDDRSIRSWHRVLFLSLGLLGLMVVPIFKAYTHLPPFMGMMLSLGVLWVVSELVSHTMDDRTKSSTGVLSALRRVDMSSIFFFLGILLAVGALGSVDILKNLAVSLQNTVGNASIIAFVIGLVSAVVDNVPLVAAGIEMFPDKPLNDPFWMLLAYCAGTGGSCLIIGSAAGVAAMGLEKIDFMWYARRVGPLALLGYISGVIVYLLQKMILG